MANLLERATLPILIITILMTAGFAIGFIDPPSFNTDLTTFVPEDENDVIIETVDAQLTETGLPFYTHITRDDGGNVLSWDSILIQENALYELENQSSMQSNLIISNISAPGILQLALDESDASGTLSDYDSWGSFLNETVDESTTCT
ncbi:MAG TPA: hypothetical protein D7H94_02490, partial [Candidatus Poseidoniales archaeon]